ncbi:MULTISPECIES: TetR/AcrR family transcriptional regulator [unclassified Halomonas]|uniref:TetR/AcrR family transcriptional regulator n=1 Tax=unclassified Halomonas TaxID=2609666 RepID=UPI002076A6F9|nr:MULTISPECIES: TetR/AcrR family transcriptional regulator [unclassified Halomonas]
MKHSAKTPLASPRKRTRLPPDIRRQYILDAALDAFAKVGFEGATVEAIALKAGLTKAGFYAHFASKEALFEALLEAIMLPVESGESGFLRHAESLEDAVDGFLDMLYGDGSSTRRLTIVRLLIIESGRDPQRIRQWYEQCYRPYLEKRQQALADHLNRYAPKAALTPDQITLAFSPSVLALFWQMIIGGDIAAERIAAIKASHRDVMLRLLSAD